MRSAQQLIADRHRFQAGWVDDPWWRMRQSEHASSVWIDIVHEALQEHKPHSAALNTRISQLENEKTNLRNEVQQKSQKISSLESSNSSLNSQVSGLYGQISSLSSQLAAEKNNAANIRSSLNNQHQLEIQKLHKQLESDKQNSDSKVIILEKEIITTRQALQTCNEQILVLEKLINEKLEKNINQQESQIHFLISKIEKLKKHLNQTPKNPKANQIKQANADTIQCSSVHDSNKLIANNNIFNRILNGHTKTDAFLQSQKLTDNAVSVTNQAK
jgi:chromosome segregation ATPase